MEKKDSYREASLYIVTYVTIACNLWGSVHKLDVSWLHRIWLVAAIQIDKATPKPSIHTMRLQEKLWKQREKEDHAYVNILDRMGPQMQLQENIFQGFFMWVLHPK